VISYKENNFRRVLNVLSYSFNSFFSALNESSVDYVIGSSPHIFILLSSYLIAKFKKAKYIVELRDLWPQSGIDLGEINKNGIIARVMFFIENFSVKRASKVIVLSNGSKDYLINKKCPEYKIVFIPNGVSKEHFSSKKLNIQQYNRDSDKEFKIIYAGAFSEANSLETIVEAALVLQGKNINVNFTLLGDGPKRKYLENLCYKKGIINVHFKDPISHSEILSFISTFDVGILTLKKAKVFRYAISPNKVFDYMATSIPVICAVRGEIGNLVEKSGSGIVIDEEDPSKLAEAILFVYNIGSEERKGMGIRGRRFVMKHFLRENLALVLRDGLMNISPSREIHQD